jgi:hypothetical protein
MALIQYVRVLERVSSYTTEPLNILHADKNL